MCVYIHPTFYDYCGTDTPTPTPALTCTHTHTHTHTLTLTSYSLPPLSDVEKSSLEQTRADKSLFVQELLLSMLAHSDSSDSSGSEDGT